MSFTGKDVSRFGLTSYG